MIHDRVASVLCCAVFAVAVATTTAAAAADSCIYYCNAGDTLSGTATCTNTYTATTIYSCPAGYTTSGTLCTMDVCTGSNALYVNGVCYTGPRSQAVRSGNQYSCYPSDGGPGGYYVYASPNYWCYVTNGVSVSCGGTCTIAASVSYACPSGGSLVPGTMTCSQTYTASLITTSAQCAITPSAAGCQWCTGISVCQLTTIACFPSCLAATTYSTICTASGSCKWCPTSWSIGVCQPTAGTCWTTCLAASAESAVCDASLNCAWCDVLPYCRSATSTCHTQCTTIAPDEPGICQVASIQAACVWCPALQYCVSTGDVTALRCASRCEAMIWRRDVCDRALSCHWCPQHGGRCKPVAGRTQGIVDWLGEASCDTGSSTDSLSTVVSATMSLTPLKSLTLSLSPPVTLSVVWSRSSSFILSISRSQPLSPSHSVTRSLSHSTSRSSSPSPIISTSTTPSLSHSATQRTPSLTSVSLSPSFRLPPCNATHAAVLRYVWPAFFSFNTTYDAVIANGFPDVLVTGDLSPELIYLVPLLLRIEELTDAHPALTVPDPFEPPNERGFVHRGATPVQLTWVSRSTLRVRMAAIPDYWIDTPEAITIDVPFEQIVLCNRTDPNSVFMPPTLQLVGVSIGGPPVNSPLSEAAQVITAVVMAVSIFAAEPSMTSSLQTLVVIGLTPCGQPTAKQSLTALRVLGPLPLGLNGFGGVVVGNVALVCGVGLLQAAAILVLRAVRGVSLPEAAATVRAPSMTIAAFLALFQGTAYAAGQLLSLPDSSAGERVGGALVFAACVAFPAVAVWFCHCRLSRKFVAYKYASSRHAAAYAEPLSVLLLPVGRVEPPDVRGRYATLIGGFRQPCPELPVLSAIVPLAFSLLTLWHPTDSDQCTILLELVLVPHVTLAVWVLYWRPHRFVYGSPLFAAGLLLNAVLVVWCLVSLSKPLSLSRGAAASVGAVQLTLQVCRLLLQLIGMKLESELLQVPTQTVWVTGTLKSDDTGTVALDAVDLQLLRQINYDEEEMIPVLPLLQPQECNSNAAAEFVGNQLLEVPLTSDPTQEEFDDDLRDEATEEQQQPKADAEDELRTVLPISTEMVNNTILSAGVESNVLSDDLMSAILNVQDFAQDEDCLRRELRVSF